MASTFDHATYLALLFAWIAPVLAIQWHAGARILRRRWRTVALATLMPTLYLAAADRYALRAGIWQLNPSHTTGIEIAGLPLEELLFFLTTNLIVVQAVVLFLAPELTLTYARALWGSHTRALRRAVTPALVLCGIAAAFVAAVSATLVASLTGSAPALAAPSALLGEVASGTDWPWLQVGQSRIVTQLGGILLYLLTATVLASIARGSCLICRTLSVVLALSSLWWYAGATSILPAAILAFGPPSLAMMFRSARRHYVWSTAKAPQLQMKV